MTSYTAPTDDMQLTLEAAGDLEAVLGLQAFAGLDRELIAQVLGEAGRFGAEVLAPLNAVGDRQGASLENGVVRTASGFADAYRSFVDGGWNAVALDPAWGGQGLPHTVATAVGEVWHAANMAFGLCPLLTQSAVELLSAHGSDALKQRYLANMVSGRWNGTMNLTEPQAGSDLAQIRAMAVPDGEAWRITGQKIFITWGEHDMTDNIVHMVLARTPDAPEGIRGISLFLVPKHLPDGDGSPGPRNDLRCVSLEHKLGIRGSPTAVMSYGDDGGAVGYLVGERHRGVEQMFTMMNHARLAIGLEGVGVAERAYQQARAFAFERVQGRDIASADRTPVPIARHADVKRMLLRMKALTQGGRALAYHAAAALDLARHAPDPDRRAAAEARVGLMTPIVKAWASDAGTEVADLGIQVHGGIGYIEETGATQHLRDARIAAIYEGTNGIQANDLAGRKVARDGGRAAARLFDEIRADLDDGTDAAAAIGPAAATALRRALAAAEATTGWICDTFEAQPAAVQAGSVPYLRLLGNLAAGWLLARKAAAAARLVPGRAAETAATAAFFALHVATTADGLATAITEASAAIAATPEQDL